jgi:hypothetical protein
MKRFLALILALSMLTAVSTACGDKPSSSKDNDDANTTVLPGIEAGDVNMEDFEVPLTVGEDIEGDDIISMLFPDENTTRTTTTAVVTVSPDNLVTEIKTQVVTQAVTQVVTANGGAEVTAADGVKVTEVVTNDGGVKVTEAVTVAGGQQVTEAVTKAGGEKVTETVTNAAGMVETKPGGDIVTGESGEIEMNTETDDSSSSGGSSDPVGGNDYTPDSADMKEIKAFWLSMSRSTDYVFDGKVITMKFKILDNVALNTVTPIEISKTDFSNYGDDTTGQKPQSLYPDIIDGSVTVGDTPKSGGASLSNFTLYCDNVAAQPGDEVLVNVSIANNPGFVAFFLAFKYDTSILKYVGYTEGEDFKAEMA